MYTILIADDHPLFRDAMRSALNSHFDGLTLLQSEDFDTTVSQLTNNEDIDLVLLDLHMPGSGDLYGLVRLREDFPDMPIAVVSGTEDEAIISRLMNFGAQGFIPKTSSADQIAEGINTILEGDLWLPEQFTQLNVDRCPDQQALAQRVALLTPQQYTVLKYLQSGLLNKQIAYELDISEATVKAHITAIFRKLEVNNRTQAVLVAGQLLLEPATTA